MTKLPSSALPLVAAPAQPLLESEVAIPWESVFESHEQREPHEPHDKAEESSDLAASLERLASWAELLPAPSTLAREPFSPASPVVGPSSEASEPAHQKAPSFGGEVFSYFSICKRKCWLHAHQIHLQQESEAVALGKLLHQISFPRENQKEFAIEGAKIDFLDASSVVHEIKSSDRFEEAHISQVKFYLYLLLLRGFPSPQGRIHYPKLKKTVDVELTGDDRCDIQEKIKEIQLFLRLERPPKAPQTALCRKCSYEEFCWG